MKINIFLCLVALFVVSCKSSSSAISTDKSIERDVWHVAQLDKKTWLLFWVDTDGSAQVYLDRSPPADEYRRPKFQLLYFPEDQTIQSFHRIDYDASTNGLVSGVKVDSTNGHLFSVSFTKINQTNMITMRAPIGEFLPTRKSIIPLDRRNGKTERENIKYEFIPIPVPTAPSSK